VPDATTDTHGLIWYLQNDPRLGPNATQIFDECDQGMIVIYIPTICLVEIVYLQEKGRIPTNLRTLLSSRLQAGTTGLTLVPLTAEVADAVARIPRAEVPDMPDRIIAATALHLGLPLISRDRKIQLSSVPTIW
jgi:PIN domain nuclease of toxin-antitoxin system